MSPTPCHDESALRLHVPLKPYSIAARLAWPTRQDSHDLESNSPDRNGALYKYFSKKVEFSPQAARKNLIHVLGLVRDKDLAPE